MDLSVRIEGIDQLVRDLDQMREGLGGQALAMAINKTGKKARAEMTRAIRAEYMLKASDIRPRLRLIVATRRSLMAVLDPFASKRKGRSMNVARFLVKKAGRRSTRRGSKPPELRFKFKRHGQVKTIAGAFIGNQGRTVFRRTGDARTPIEPVQIIDVPQMFAARTIGQRVVAKIRTDLQLEVDRAVAEAIRRFQESA